MSTKWATKGKGSIGWYYPLPYRFPDSAPPYVPRPHIAAFPEWILFHAKTLNGSPFL